MPKNILVHDHQDLAMLAPLAEILGIKIFMADANFFSYPDWDDP
jgi:hypothetical protein